MTINVRGANGSGKSFLIRRIMALYPQRQPFYAQARLMGVAVKSKQLGERSRKAPLAYLCSGLGEHKLAIIGSYENECGGCDTIVGEDRAGRVYQLVQEFAESGHHVLFEGYLLSKVVTQQQALFQQGAHCLVIGLNTPLEQCIAATKARRLGRNDTREYDPKNLTDAYRATERAMERLKEVGLSTVWLDREGAFCRICKEFGIPLRKGKSSPAA